MCHKPSFGLFEPCSMYSYVSINHASRLGFSYHLLYVAMHLATPIYDSLVVDQICRSCIFTIWEYDMQVNIIIQHIVNFDIILGKVNLSPYHVVLDNFSKTIP